MKVVPIISGGLDSITMLYALLDEGNVVEDIVSFNYGQRHKKELEFAAKHAEAMHINHHIIDLHASGLSAILKNSGSSLVDGTVDVPEGHYAEENMKATVVPNRNMMMLAIAGSVAVATSADNIAIAVHSGDHFIYPDCRPSFIHALGLSMRLGNEGFGAPVTDVYAPFLYWTKEEIAERAIFLSVPLNQTWSCYKGGVLHCGRCGTCVERLEAIDGAYTKLGLSNADPTKYEDSEYWHVALQEGPNSIHAVGEDA